MTDSDALLAAVLANPEDDTPRLVFADWLDEHDEPERAEFIRVQCELARIGHLHPPADEEDREIIRRAKALRRREEELLNEPVGVQMIRELGSAWDDEDHCSILLEDRPQREPFLRWRGVRRVFYVSRGFVSSVSLTLAQFLGGPCGRCEGSGIAQVSDRPFGYEGHGTWPGPCPGPCKGDPDYRTPGLAPALFKAAPIEEVRLTDREPLRVSPDHRFQWTRVSVGDGQLVTPYDLPPELFDLLERWVEYDPGDPDDHLPFKTFSTRDAAVDALSAACVAYGRANAAGCWHEEECPEERCISGYICLGGVPESWETCLKCNGSGTVRVPGLPPLSTHQAGGPAPR